MALSLGARIKELREQRGLSLRGLESMTELSSGYLSLLENEKVKQPKPPVLYKLARALDAPYQELMTLAGYTPDPAQGTDERLGSFVAFKGAEKLSEEQRREVQDFIYFKLRQRHRPAGAEDDRSG